MKKKKRESIEALLLALPCVLQVNEDLNDEEKAAGWRIFEKLLSSYIKDKGRNGKGVQ